MAIASFFMHFFYGEINMPSTAEVAQSYHTLSRKEIAVPALFPLKKWLPTKYFLNFRFHWNAIWHHRLAMEIACQMKEGKDWYSHQSLYGLQRSVFPCQ